MQDQLFQICKTYLSFTGALLFKRDLWCNVDTEVFYGNRFGDMCTIANFPQSSKVLIMQEPCVLIRLGNAEWSNINFKVWYKYYREAIIKHSQLSDKVKKILVPDTLFWHLKFLLYNRAMDTYKLSHYKEYLKQRSFKIRFIGIMIFLVPSFLIRWFFIIIAICQKNSLALYNFTEGRKSKNSWLSSE